MTSIIDEQKIKIISKENNILTFDKKLLKISNVLNNLMEDNDENTIPLNNFDNFHLKILEDYFNFILKSDYNFDEINKTVNYYNNFHNFKNNVIIRSFLENLSINDVNKLYDVSRYLDINFLQEELIRKILKNIIDSKINKIKELNSLILSIENNIKYVENDLNEFKEENKIYGYYTSDEESDDKEEDDDDEEEEDDEEVDEEEFESVREFDNKVNQFNDHIKKNKESLLNQYRICARAYRNRIQQDKNLLNQKNLELDNEKNNLKENIKSFIEDSQNIFYVGNAQVCNDCQELYFLTECNKYIDKSYECNSKCYYCDENISNSLELLNHDINHILVKMDYICDNDDDKEAYEDSEMENINNMSDIIINLRNNNYSAESEILLDKCFGCNFDGKSYIKCGETDDFGRSIKKMCCGESYCDEHFGDNKVSCSHEGCNYEVSFCNECNISNPDRYYHREYSDSFCIHCSELFCTYHLREGLCENDRHRDYD